MQIHPSMNLVVAYTHKLMQNECEEQSPDMAPATSQPHSSELEDDELRFELVIAVSGPFIMGSLRPINTQEHSTVRSIASTSEVGYKVTVCYIHVDQQLFTGSGRIFQVKDSSTEYRCLSRFNTRSRPQPV